MCSGKFGSPLVVKIFKKRHEGPPWVFDFHTLSALPYPTLFCEQHCLRIDVMHKFLLPKR